MKVSRATQYFFLHFLTQHHRQTALWATGFARIAASIPTGPAGSKRSQLMQTAGTEQVSTAGSAGSADVYDVPNQSGFAVTDVLT